MTADKATVLELPQARFPIVNRVLSTHPFPQDPQAAKNGSPEIPFLPPDYRQPLLWEFGKEHPVIPDMKIVRMYVIAGVGVEVYSSSKDGKTGTRNVVPWALVRMTEEIMDAATFVDEIVDADAEAQGEPGDEPKDPPRPQPAAMQNGGA